MTLYRVIFFGDFGYLVDIINRGALKQSIRRTVNV